MTALPLKTQLQSILASLAQNEIPDRIPDLENDWASFDTLCELRFQSECQSTHKMFGLVDLEWTKQFASELGSARVLEIMAGRGWLAKALYSHGISIHATDGHIGYGIDDTTPVHPVRVISAEEAIQHYAPEADVLLCSWPPYDDPALHLALRYWPQRKPIYIIGEGYGGCTADDEFWDNFVVETMNHHPNQNGQHSRVFKGIWPKGGIL